MNFEKFRREIDLAPIGPTRRVRLGGERLERKQRDFGGIGSPCKLQATGRLASSFTGRRQARVGSNPGQGTPYICAGTTCCFALTIGQYLRLSDTPEAVRFVESGGVRGKVVITV